jgi:hypothetical protein
LNAPEIKQTQPQAHLMIVTTMAMKLYEMTVATAAKKRPATVTSETIPPCANRQMMARLVSDRFFLVSPGMLRIWPIAWKLIGSWAIGETAEAFAEAERRLAAAPVISPKDARG